MLDKRRGSRYWRGALRSQPRVAEAAGPSLHLLSQHYDVGVVGQTGLEVLQLLALLGLHLQRDLAATVQELRDLLELCHLAAAGRHRRGAYAHAARRQRGGVAVDGVAV